MSSIGRPQLPAESGGSGTPVDPALVAALRRMGLVSAHSRPNAEALTGGVSSDIHLIECDGARFCVKRALAKLKVAADWRAPIARNAWEVAWMRVARGIVPDAVPLVLGEDAEAGCFAMEYLEPASYPLWKRLLAQGCADAASAGAVGDVLGRIHAATADRPDIAERFRTDETFHAIRLEPYLVATARVHPDLANRLALLVERTASTRRALVHGDFSPKNILIGRRGPVILDAECAWFGDPAFDVAFVLNHLLLKGAWHPEWRQRYVAAFEALWRAYRGYVGWEPVGDVEARAVALLPALLLARIDGKSPVEYLTTGTQRTQVRTFARERVLTPPTSLARMATDWLLAA